MRCLIEGFISMMFGTLIVVSLPAPEGHPGEQPITINGYFKPMKFPSNYSQPLIYGIPKSSSITRCQRVCTNNSISTSADFKIANCTAVVSSHANTAIDFCTKCHCTIMAIENRRRSTDDSISETKTAINLKVIKSVFKSLHTNASSPSEHFKVYLKVHDQISLESKFSQAYDPKTNTSTSGFVPIMNPYIKATQNQRTNHQNSRNRSPVAMPRSHAINQKPETERMTSRYDKNSEVPTSIFVWPPETDFKSKRLRQGRRIKSRQNARAKFDINWPKSINTQVKSGQNSLKTHRSDIPKISRLHTGDMKRLKTPVVSKLKEKLTTVTFSVPYNPESRDKSSGFVPLIRPQSHKTTKSTTSQKNPKSNVNYMRIEEDARNEPKLVRKASFEDESILGDGNFEIITGGMFLDPDDNEIGRYFSLKTISFPTNGKKKRKKFVPSRDFHYPKYFQGDTPSETAMLLPMSYGEL